VHRETLTVETPGRALIDLRADLGQAVERSGIAEGLCHLFVLHTSASLIIQENADPDVCGDLERWMSTMVNDGDRIFRHRDEGPDDMSAHVRSALTSTSLTLPVAAGRLALGTWQAVYLWEHRTSPKRRSVLVTVTG
jgi:secondary thiamine-phosphate synthase enzyme